MWISKGRIMVTWGTSIVEMSTAMIIVCCIHCLLEKKNYEILFKGPYFQTWPKIHKMLGTTLEKVMAKE